MCIETIKETVITKGTIPVLLGAIFILGCSCLETKLVENKNDKIIKGYHSFYYESANGEKLKYRFYMPADNGSKRKYPLVVHFHGAGSRGNNNKSQLYMTKKSFKQNY
jgi:predicted peptidase